MQKPLAAHIQENGNVQSIKEHLYGTAKLARQFGDAFENSDFSYLCGLIHDIGKYSDEFQKRIWDAGPKVDHSTAGAIEINGLIKNFGWLMAYCIAGHHTGLLDGGSIVDIPEEKTLAGRIKRVVPNYKSFSNDICLEKLVTTKPPKIIPLGEKGFSISFFIRMIFSCLVDADYLDTESFFSGGKTLRGIGKSIDDLCNMLTKEISKYNLPTREINIKRNEILAKCINMSKNEKGLYTLTVPTGGGKTISSIAFALEHAKRHGMNRIIYAIPYTSIIEQTAAEFKRIFGSDSVLEHHSNFEYNDLDKDDSLESRQKLATENWDAPIVVTTNVQFFESVFACKTSKCRRIHNIANSVVIFDEAQMLPLQYLKPCVRTIAELVKNYACTVILCSATQPSLGEQFPPEVISREICSDIDATYAYFKRTQIVNIGTISDDDLISRIGLNTQALCIVSTRKHAQNLFEGLPGEGCYHLSTLMCPEHRKKVLSEIKNRLKADLPCRVVSTSLIEAGVDVDFPVVYRSAAGLDSEIQAAGRCNREGRRSLENSFVYIFDPEEKYKGHLPSMLKRPITITQTIERQYPNDVSSPTAIVEYFKLLYQFSGNELDAKNIVKRLDEGVMDHMSFPFVQIAKDFRIIENDTYNVIIPLDENSNELIKRLRDGERTQDLFRKIQMYSVNLYQKDYEALCGVGVLKQIDKGVVDTGLSILTDLSKYHKDMGLQCPDDGGVAIFT